MKICIFFVCAFCLVAAPAATARIGETPAEISAMFGPAIQRQSGFLVLHSGEVHLSPHSSSDLHQKSGVLVEVNYLNGKCQRIAYVKGELGKVARAFTKEEITLLLTNNLPPPPTEKMHPTFERFSVAQRSTEMETEEFHTAHCICEFGGRIARVVRRRGIASQQIVIFTVMYMQQIQQENKVHDAEAQQKAIDESKQRLKGF